MTPHESFHRLIALAFREPEAVRAALHHAPDESKRRCLEFVLSVAEARGRDYENLAANLEDPVRLQAMIRFWHELEPRGWKH